MIVRDEAPVIRRCLDSVRPLIDAWVIVDTGSVDGTQAIVRDHLSDLPGELVERPWKNFGHNRTEALGLARPKGDYLLIVDADEVLETAPGFQLPPLREDSYRILTKFSGCSYYRTQLVRSELGWRFEGVLHEYVTSTRARTEGTLSGIVNIPRTDGARSRDPKKYERDAEVLDRALAEDPDNARYAFYLAQSLRDAGLLERAIAAYRHRARMGGFAEEVWYSTLQVGALLERQGGPFEPALAAYLEAHQLRPTRTEALCALAKHYREHGQYALAYVFAAPIARAPRPDDALFVDDSVYEWRALDEYAIAAYYVGKHREALAANDALLGSPVLPESERGRIVTNRAFCTKALGLPEGTPGSESSPVAAAGRKWAPRKHSKKTEKRRHR